MGDMKIAVQYSPLTLSLYISFFFQITVFATLNMINGECTCTKIYPHEIIRICYVVKFLHSRGIDTLSEEVTLSKLFFFPSGKGSTLKGKNLLPAGANSFLSE